MFAVGDYSSRVGRLLSSRVAVLQKYPMVIFLDVISDFRKAAIAGQLRMCHSVRRLTASEAARFSMINNETAKPETGPYSVLRLIIFNYPFKHDGWWEPQANHVKAPPPLSDHIPKKSTKLVNALHSKGLVG